MSDRKYGTIVAQRKVFPMGEPLFLFRAQDKFAPTVLRLYAALLRTESSQGRGQPLKLHTLANEVEKEAQDMEIWQDSHICKVPD